jgi:hypothetical protein
MSTVYVDVRRRVKGRQQAGSGVTKAGGKICALGYRTELLLLRSAPLVVPSVSTTIEEELASARVHTRRLDRRGAIGATEGRAPRGAHG